MNSSLIFSCETDEKVSTDQSGNPFFHTWIGDIVDAFDVDANGDGVRDGMFKFNVGDEIEVVVRKPAGNYFDELVTSISGGRGAREDLIVAVKGGMILNTQYGS